MKTSFLAAARVSSIATPVREAESRKLTVMFCGPAASSRKHSFWERSISRGGSSRRFLSSESSICGSNGRG